MIFNGRKFRKVDAVRCIGAHQSGPQTGFAIFVRVLPKSAGHPVDSFNLNAQSPSAKPEYAVMIPWEGYSQTNLMYGTDGKVYLAKDGYCYKATGGTPKKAKIKK